MSFHDSVPKNSSGESYMPAGCMAARVSTCGGPGIHGRAGYS